MLPIALRSPLRVECAASAQSPHGGLVRSKGRPERAEDGDEERKLQREEPVLRIHQRVREEGADRQPCVDARAHHAQVRFAHVQIILHLHRAIESEFCKHCTAKRVWFLQYLDEKGEGTSSAVL